MSDVYGYKPNVNPVVTASTLQPTTEPSTPLTTSTPKAKRKIDSDESDEENNSILSNTSTSSFKSKPSKKRPKTNSQEMIDTIVKIHDEQKEAEEKKVKLAEQMHNEKMAMFAEFLTVLKESNRK